MSKCVACLLVWFFIFSPEANTQRLGLLPPSVKWKQIVDDSLRIVYPEGQEENAQRVASLMLKFASLDPIGMSKRYRRISVLLQPHTNISNGYVGLAPYVSEFYLQPNENPFALGSLPWIDLLSVHEYRHVQQVNAANKGLSHLGKIIFGELAYTGLYNLAIPNWFREGDAVYAESKWTLQGRGRLSSFTLPFRMKLMEGDEWNYYKVRNGSYREFTPDHYSLGYLMIQYGNHLFGESAWDTIIHEAATFKHLLDPFSGPVKDRTGYKNKHLYAAAMDWYRDKWNALKVPDIEYPLVPISEKDKQNVFFDMTFPDADGDGSIYTAITTFDNTAAIYKISPDGKRKKIINLGLQQDTYFDHSQRKIVWTELRYDPRWIRRDKNVMIVYDERTGGKRVIMPSKGFYSPSLNADSRMIVSLHVDDEGKYNLRIHESNTGKQIASLPNPDNLYLGYPIWSEDEKEIIATARNNKGEMALVAQEITTGDIRQITHYSFNILGRPRLNGQWVALTATLDELDQVYAVDITEGIFYRVSSGNRAHYDPCWDPVQNSIVCSEYYLDGKKLVHLPGMPSKWKMSNLGNGIKPLEGATEINLLAKPVAEREFETADYSPWFNAINFHSWTVTADDPVWGIEGRSNNIMNNISLAAGYEYNRNSRAAGPYLNLEFGMWYPVLTLGINRTSREQKFADGREFNIVNEGIDAGVTLPLFFSAGVFNQAVNISSIFNAGISKVRPEVPQFDDFRFNYLRHRFIIINSRRRAYRQPLPTWGQRMDISYAHEVSGVPISQLYLSGDLALPAIKRSHYLLLRGEYLRQDIGEGFIQLGSSYAGARGFDQFIGATQYHLGATYGFPILYPDIGIGNIFYTRRIRMQPFYDMAYTNAEEQKYNWVRSTGLELLVDFEFPPVSVGVRYSRLLDGYDGSPNRFEIFLPVERF